MGSVTHDTAVGAQGAKVRIIITEVSTDHDANSSQVQVTGSLVGGNSNSGASGFNNISCSITNGLSFVGSPFGFPAGIAAHGVFVFINHTFSVTHDSDGSKTVSAQVNYSDTGTAMFGAFQGSSASLTLTSFGNPAGAPGDPVVTNILPTSCSVSWDPPADDGGFPIKYYFVDLFRGDEDAPLHEYQVFGNSINLTGLTAGQDYRVNVTAYNGPGNGAGLSDPSGDTDFTTLAGAWMRVDGVWVVAIPFVRKDGIWHMAVPYIRVAGVWQPTH